MATIGEIIQRLREQKGWTTRELAEKVGLSAGAVNQRETGKTRVKADEIPMWAGVFGISPDSLESMWNTSSMPLRAAENAGIPIINKAPAGPAWDFEAYGTTSREGHSYLARETGEESDDLFAVEVVGDSMTPELRTGDLLVMWPVAQGVPTQSIDGRIVLASFSQEHGGGVSLAQLKLTGESDDHRGLRATLVKLNAKHRSRDIYLTDLDRLAVAKRIHRVL